MAMLETIWQDVRYAARSLRRTPGFTVAALLTLALGIGATSAIFTIVNAALLKPPPYPEPDRLFVLTPPDGGSQTGQLFLYLRGRLTAFERLAAQRTSNGSNLVAGDFVAYVDALRVSEGYFEVLGVPPLLGRGFSRAEDQPSGPNVVVIGEALWRRAYGGRTDVLGEAIQLGGVPYTIVGVLPAAFRSVPEAQVWTPLRTTATDNSQNYRIIGRLREGVAAVQAGAELDVLRADIQREFPRYNPNRLAATAWMPLRQVLGINIREPLLMLLGAVGFLLLIACLNVASLQLTRALGRRRELVTRSALGGSPFRLVRQVMTESALLGIAGALAGLAVAVAGTQLLFGLVSEDAARQMLSGETATVDWRVFGFTLTTALVCSVVFGVAPAVTSSRVDIRPALRASATTTSSRRTVWLRRALAGGELALAVVLLVGAGLLIRTLYNLHSAELGFNPTNVMVGRMSLQRAVDDGAQLEALLERGLSRIRTVPGVSAAAASNGVPVDRGINFALEPPPAGRVSDVRSIDWRYVSSDYFTVFDVPLLAGRLFDERDRSGSVPVAIVNEAFARAYFGRRDVTGESIGLVSGYQDPPRQIVGVVADVKARSGSGWTQGLTALGAPTAPAMFVPAGQGSATSVRGTHGVFPMTWSIKTARLDAMLASDLEDAMRAVDAGVTFIAFEPMDAVIARDLDLPRLVASLLATFAGLAITLAVIGLYGLIAYAATQRRREVGVRIAFGATAAEILRRFMAEGLAVACAGMAVGIIGAAFVTRLLTTLLFDVTPLDATTFAAVGGLLLGVAAIASVLPAVRAARVDPLVVLRAD